MGDIVLNSAEARQAIPGAGLVDGEVVHNLIISVTKSFIETVTEGETTWYPATILESFPELTQILDVSYISEWATEHFGDNDYTEIPESASASLHMFTGIGVIGLTSLGLIMTSLWHFF